MNWSRSKKIRFAFFIFGLLLFITSWFLDNTLKFPFLLKVISPNYSSVKEVFDVLDDDRFGHVPITHKGCQILLKWWEPKPPDEIIKNAKFISRGQIIIDAFTGKQNFYELYLSMENPKYYYKNYVWWNDLKAKKLMIESLDYWRYEYFSIGVFVISLLITAISGSLEFFVSETAKNKHV